MNESVFDRSMGTKDCAGQPLLLTAEQAAESLAICRTKVYELLRNGELESVQIGASRRIPSAALSEYVERLRAQTKAVSASIPPHQTVPPGERNG